MHMRKLDDRLVPVLGGDLDTIVSSERDLQEIYLLVRRVYVWDRQRVKIGISSTLLYCRHQFRGAQNRIATRVHC